METELEHARTARVHNPSTQGAFFLEAVALAALARVDEVRNLMAEARTHGDAFNQGLLHRQVAMDLRYHGHEEAARELLEESLRRYEEAGVIGSAAAALGDRETALAMEEVLMEMEAAPYVFGIPARWRALIRAQLGEMDTAVQFLEEAYAAGSAFGMWIHYQPQLDALRG